MLFAPPFIITHRDEDRDNPGIAISLAAEWPAPSKADIENAADALIQKYKGATIYVDTSGTPTLISRVS